MKLEEELMQLEGHWGLTETDFAPSFVCLFAYIYIVVVALFIEV
jgi:hypothetical protein